MAADGVWPNAEARVDRPDPPAIRLVMAMANGAAALAVISAAAALLAHPDVVARGIAPIVLRLADAPRRADLTPMPAPTPAPTGRGMTPASAPMAAADSYAGVAAAIARGDPTALPRLTGLASAGDTQAQRHLASLYESGAAGLPRDPGAARAWTERAAVAGDRLAMHNLGLFLANGEGGARDTEAAAAWFRRAATKGVVDSEYNLGLLYQTGRGVERNLREAYRWFSIAANAGDLAAREKQVELEGRLTSAERSGLDREAANFEPGSAEPPPGLVIPPATTLAETQALLARQGYYLGAVDGVPSPALRAAASAYLRDHPAPLAAAPSPAASR